MAAFLHCQMPVDGRQTTILRAVPNAPGHVKDLPRQQNPSGIGATKQGNQTTGALEALLTDKHYASLREHATYAVSFVNNPSNCIANCNYLLVYLSTVLYPECRYLDLLRVLQIWVDFCINCLVSQILYRLVKFVHLVSKCNIILNFTHSDNILITCLYTLPV